MNPCILLARPRAYALGRFLYTLPMPAVTYAPRSQLLRHSSTINLLHARDWHNPAQMFDASWNCAHVEGTLHTRR